MSATEFLEYLQDVQTVLNEVIAAGHALSVQFQADQRSITMDSSPASSFLLTARSLLDEIEHMG
jgi:hypothetical protein